MHKQIHGAHESNVQYKTDRGIEFTLALLEVQMEISEDRSKAGL